MTDVEPAVFRETSADIRVSEVPLAHVSVELGHLYMEDLVAPGADLNGHFAAVAPWVDRTRLASIARVPVTRLRSSTCLLIDDYFGAPMPPAKVLTDLLAAASDNDLRVDYVARESACAVAGDIALADHVEAAIVADPPFGTTGARPAPSQSGWLSNGERTPIPVQAAMAREIPWQPPRENGAHRHSVFVDVELWDREGGTRVWSCPMLAAVWQLLRLGVVRVSGRGPVTPVRVDSLADLPSDWSELPPVIQLTDRPAPFAAYRSFSVLDARFFPVEHAVRTILSQVTIEPEVAGQAVRRARREGVAVPVAVPDRISYVLTGG